MGSLYCQVLSDRGYDRLDISVSRYERNPWAPCIVKCCLTEVTIRWTYQFRETREIHGQISYKTFRKYTPQALRVRFHGHFADVQLRNGHLTREAQLSLRAFLYLFGIHVFSPRVKRQGLEADYSPPSSTEVKNGGAIPSLLLVSSWHSA
jgi:hypothetical protein